VSKSVRSAGAGDTSSRSAQEPIDAEADVDVHPVAADARRVVDRKIPADLRLKYEIYSYKNAAVILSEVRHAEFGDICAALREFSITSEMIRKAGGNESEMPRVFSKALRPLGWHETVIRADLHVSLRWREVAGHSRSGRPITTAKERIVKRDGYLDGHKIDYVKGQVAFDLEWNSNDQTFDRDLYAFNAFFLSGAIDCAVLVTRSESLNEVFHHYGLMSKYGASTTWMGKLLYRLNAGRNGGCPVLVVGITPTCVSDWSPGPTPKLAKVGRTGQGRRARP
jgi:hypothetical protein